VRDAHALDARQVDDLMDLLLYRLQADERVELVEERVERRSGRGRLAREAAEGVGIVPVDARIGRTRSAGPGDVGAAAQLGEHHAAVPIDRVELTRAPVVVLPHAAERARGVRDAERRLVVRPRAGGAAAPIVLAERPEQRRRVVDEAGVAPHEVAVAQLLEARRGERGIGGPERRAERHELVDVEPAVGHEERGGDTACLLPEPVDDPTVLVGRHLGPDEHPRTDALDELAHRPGQRVRRRTDLLLASTASRRHRRATPRGGMRRRAYERGA
jgi:hypothetical protein